MYINILTVECLLLNCTMRCSSTFRHNVETASYRALAPCWFVQWLCYVRDVCGYVLDVKRPNHRRLQTYKVVTLWTNIIGD